MEMDIIDGNIEFEIKNGKGNIKEYYDNGKLQFKGEYKKGEKMEREKNIVALNIYNLKENI